MNSVEIEKRLADHEARLARVEGMVTPIHAEYAAYNQAKNAPSVSGAASVNAAESVAAHPTVSGAASVSGAA